MRCFLIFIFALFFCPFSSFSFLFFLLLIGFRQLRCIQSPYRGIVVVHDSTCSCSLVFSLIPLLVSSCVFSVLFCCLFFSFPDHRVLCRGPSRLGVHALLQFMSLLLVEGFDFTSTFSFLAIKDSSIGDHVSQPVADVLIWAFSEHCSADNQED